MKVLIVPMAAMAETAGSFLRAKLLARALLDARHEVALCCAKDVNYVKIEGVTEYPLSVPMPLGIPCKIARFTFPLAQKLGITAKKEVHSFEEVLHLTGNIAYGYLRQSIPEIQKAIKEYKPDVLYSEFNMAAIIAAKVENIPLVISASVPTQAAYAASPKYAGGVNKILREYGLGPLNSSLELFDLAAKKCVPSSYELEPFSADNVVYCGSLTLPKHQEAAARNKILVYMGNGTISRRKMVKEITQAFRESPYEVYIAGQGLTARQDNNIHLAPRFAFADLFPETLLYINHGGQNSISGALIYGVPLLLCPGKVFERQYNAASVVKNGAGLELKTADFTAAKISAIARHIIGEEAFYTKAKKLGGALLAPGGAAKMVATLETLVVGEHENASL